MKMSRETRDNCRDWNLQKHDNRRTAIESKMEMAMDQQKQNEAKAKGSEASVVRKGL